MNTSSNNEKKERAAVPDEQVTKPILETLAVVGFADRNQLQQSSQLSRDKLRRTLDQMQADGWIHMLRQPIRRSTGRGRSPGVFRLEKEGAKLLGARTSNLREERPIAHVLGMLDVWLAIQKAGLESATDAVIPFSGGQLRPDHRVTLPDGRQALIEVEQDATPSLLRRITSSLRNKQKFFTHEAAQGISSTVRMLVALPDGSNYQRTLGIWQQAIDVLIAELEAPLSFQVAALPLDLFLDTPNWSEPPDPTRWSLLNTVHEGNTESSLTAYLPQISRRNPNHDRLILAALLKSIHDNQKQTDKPDRTTLPSPYFFASMQTIYAASHDDSLSPLERAAYPRASLFLLRHYLHMHRPLRDQIARRVQAGSTTMRWNTTVIFHRMQSIVDLFLGYHNWRSDGPLLASVETAAWNTNEPRNFRAVVNIRHRDILMYPGDTLVPDAKMAREAEQALSWVLTALFRYAPDVGFKAPPFW